MEQVLAGRAHSNLVSENYDRAIWSLAAYRNLVLHERDLRGRIGIEHDRLDGDGPIWLRIARLERSDPPTLPPVAANWITQSRDPAKEPAIEAHRLVSLSAEEAETLVLTGKAAREDVSTAMRAKPGEDLRDVLLRLERDCEAKAAVEAYLKDRWRPWAERELPRRQTIAIYDRLFNLQQSLRLEGAEKPLEVVWGMGIARWRLPPNELDHPLIERLVDVELEENGGIVVRPRAAEPTLAIKPLIGAGNPATGLVVRFFRKFVKDLPADLEVNPFEKKSFAPVLAYACSQLDRAGLYYPDHVPTDDKSVPAAGPNLVVTDTWAIYARPRSGNFFIADIDRLRSAVDEAEELPAPARRLVVPPPDTPIDVHASLGLGIGGSSHPSLESGGIAPEYMPIRYFFPKPFNDEQLEIATRLETPGVDGVVVQGPPGTGKSHSIANIICHYLSTGRRVLVTSKSEGALAVLRGQIPPGIRELSISLLTSEREGLRQLEATVSILTSSISRCLDGVPDGRRDTRRDPLVHTGEGARCFQRGGHGAPFRPGAHPTAWALIRCGTA
jgi:hypothetical protein